MKRTLAIVVLAVLGGGSVAFAATMTTTADDLTAFTASTTVATIPAPAAGTTLWLGSVQANPNSGPTRPLVTNAPSISDTLSPAPQIAKDATGASDNNSQSASGKVLYWRTLPASKPAAIDGTVELVFHSAAVELPGDKGGFVWAFLRECNNNNGSPNNCTTFASGGLGAKPWNPAGQYAERTIAFVDANASGVAISDGSPSRITRTLDTTKQLVLQITVGADAFPGGQGETDLVFQLNRTGFPSRLVISPAS